MASRNYKYYQPNDKDLKDQYGDCVVRALTKVMSKTWMQVFDDLISYAKKLQCMTLNDEIVICKECKKPEYWGEMRWLSGRCVCRDCYKANYEQETKEPYTWDDLDGKRPTMNEYREQERRKCENMN